MKKVVVLLFSLLLFVCCMTGCLVTPDEYSVVKVENESLTKRLDELRTKYDAMQTEYDALKAEYDAVVSRLDAAIEEKESLSQAYTSLLEEAAPFLKTAEDDPKPEAEPEPERVVVAGKHLIEPGDVFDTDGYIILEGVEILYNGEEFEIRNDRSDIIRITVRVVGVKADGTYEVFQMPAFGGVDEYQYEQDLKENGWAVESITNLVRPGDTLEAPLAVFDFGGDTPSPDEDGNGYYDIVFVVHPQSSETTITVSANDPESEVYKFEIEKE